MSEEPKPKKRPGNPNPAQHRIPEERYAAARIIYESVPGMSYAKLADQTGISERSLEEKSRKEGWKKSPLLPDKNMTEQAQAVADQYAGKLAEYGPEAGAQQKHEAMVQTAQEFAVAERAKILDRHRREWGAVRNLLYDSVKGRQFADISKLAKISAETLAIIQANERKAWGLKDEEQPTGVTIVIDRGS